MSKVGMCIVHIQHAKFLNPNVSHEKTTKQFINNNPNSTKTKNKRQ